MAKGSPATVHSVHFYDHDIALIKRLSSIVGAAIGVGNSVLIVATPEHRRALGNPMGLKKLGRWTCRDAQQALGKFMRADAPDPDLFRNSVGQWVRAARQAAWNQEKGLTVFGEMVALLWSQGNKEGALKLETLWNELLSNRSFHLHCAYPRSLFGRGDDAHGFRLICNEHSHVIGELAA